MGSEAITPRTRSLSSARKSCVRPLSTWAPSRMPVATSTTLASTRTVSPTVTTEPLTIFSMPRRCATSIALRFSRVITKSMNSSENTRTPESSVSWVLRPSRRAGPIQALA